MEFVHCLIIGIVIALAIHSIKSEIMSKVNTRWKKHVTRNGLIRGSLVYAFERK